MWKAIVYKEWIKTRRYLFAALLLTAGFAGYGLLRLYRAVELMGAGHIWEVMVTRNAVFIDPIKFVRCWPGCCWPSCSSCPRCSASASS